MSHKVLIPYVTATWPTVRECLQVLDLYVKYGDIIELGVPTDNPKYDGPTIRMTHREAEMRGLEALSTILEKFRSDRPVMILTYLEDHLSRLESFFSTISEYPQVRTVLFPDLLFDYYDMLERYVELCRKYRIEPSFFISTKFPYDLARALTKYSPYLIYMGAQAATGIELPIYVERNVRIFREILKDVRFVVGFAISRRTQVEKLLQLGVDGIVIGTELVKRYKIGGLQAVEEFLKEVKETIQQYSTHT